MLAQGRPSWQINERPPVTRSPGLRSEALAVDVEPASNWLVVHGALTSRTSLTNWGGTVFTSTCEAKLSAEATNAVGRPASGSVSWALAGASDGPTRATAATAAALA